MCRNIKPLFNFEPEATDEEIKNAAVQFVRKVSGFQKVSQVNQKAFDEAVEEVSKTVKKLFDGLETSAEKKNREVEAEKAKNKSILRFIDTK